MIRIGLTQRVSAIPGRDERRDGLDQAWAPLLLANGLLPIPLPNLAGAAGELVAELGLEGVLLTGGNDLSGVAGAQGDAPERDAFEGRLLEVCAERGLPVLGVCRGAQLLVRHCGGEVAPVAGHVATRHPIRATGSGGLPLADRDEVNSYHRYGLPADALGPDLLAAALSPDGTVEAVAHRRLPFWGVLWHPERDPHDARDAEILRARFPRSRP